MPGSAKTVVLKLRKAVQVRALLGEFSSTLGKETLRFRIFQDHETFVCERRFVEKDGTSFTVVLPFDEPAVARALLAADPYYDQLRDKVGRVLIRLNSESRDVGGKRPV